MTVERRENMRGGQGTVLITHCFGKEEFAAKSRLCARMLVPPGASIGEHRHEGEDEVYVVLRGQGILDDGKNKTRITAGDAVLTGRGESHSVQNDGTDELEIVAVIMCY